MKRSNSYNVNNSFESFLAEFQRNGAERREPQPADAPITPSTLIGLADAAKQIRQILQQFTTAPQIEMLNALDSLLTPREASRRSHIAPVNLEQISRANGGSKHVVKRAIDIDKILRQVDAPTRIETIQAAVEPLTLFKRARHPDPVLSVPAIKTMAFDGNFPTKIRPVFLHELVAGPGVPPTTRLFATLGFGTPEVMMARDRVDGLLAAASQRDPQVQRAVFTALAHTKTLDVPAVERVLSGLRESEFLEVAHRARESTPDNLPRGTTKSLKKMFDAATPNADASQSVIAEK